jgi:drug/metabolite transporter (DMT)-like permease
MVIDHFSPQGDGVVMSCIQFFVCSILCAVGMVITETPTISSIMAAGVPILYAGVMSCGVAFTAQIFGQKYSDPTVASILLCLESVFAVIFGLLLLDDKLNSRETIGCVIMFVAILLTQIPAEKFGLKRK